MTQSANGPAQADALLAHLNALGAYLKLHGPARPPAAGEEGWLAEEDLARTDRGPQLRILDQLAAHGFGGSRRALSASVMLRYGWSSGALIGPWLMAGCVIRGASLVLRFSPNAVLTEVAVRSHTDIRSLCDTPIEHLRQMLANELVRRAAPIVEAHHVWSGFSRKALWAMVTSSWGAQFGNISERLGDPERGLSEAKAVQALNPDVNAASPDMYIVHAESRRSICQKRRLCCLWFKTPQRQFCASCPILSPEERMERNRRWVAQSGVTSVRHENHG